MPNYHRARDGTAYFFTVVTWQRQPILCEEPSRQVLREVIRELQLSYPFIIEAWVLLPDHLHCIWTLPEGDSDYSLRWGWLKKEFTKRIRGRVETVCPTSSRQRHREAGVWQRRFWEHQIRDEVDFAAHCDYIHFNPVKHGLAVSPQDWPYSTLHRLTKAGIYPVDWGDPAHSLPENIGGE